MDLVYDTALFLHITGVLLLFAGLGIEAVALGGLRAATTGDQARTWLRAMRSLRITGPLAGVLILVPGLAMAAGSWGGTGWILVGLVTLVVIAAVGAIVTGRRMAVVGPLAARSQGTLGPEARAALRDARLLGSLFVRVLLGLGAVLVMTVKPGLLVSALVVLVAAAVGVAGAAVGAGRPSPTLPGSETAS